MLFPFLIVLLLLVAIWLLPTARTRARQAVPCKVQPTSPKPALKPGEAIYSSQGITPLLLGECTPSSVEPILFDSIVVSTPMIKCGTTGYLIMPEHPGVVYPFKLVADPIVPTTFETDLCVLHHSVPLDVHIEFNISGVEWLATVKYTRDNCLYLIPDLASTVHK